MKYSESEFLELLDDIKKNIEFVYYPKSSNKKMKNKIKRIESKVKKDGLSSILTREKERL